MILTAQQKNNFHELVWNYSRDNHRPMPWRETPIPYYVLVSELMLQQTQVPRVIPKFASFIQQFPDIAALAGASLAEVLSAWSGLGYNRRAKFLHQAAEVIARQHGGDVPSSIDELVKLPGIGPNTAGAIMAYAFNQPVIFIETNIRTVFIHEFYQDRSDVSDRELRELVEQTLDQDDPRHWFWALMDYGTHLKQTVGGRLDQSKHYKKQSPLAGSLREMRGHIIRVLTEGPVSEQVLRRAVKADERFPVALEALTSEGLIEHQNNHWCLTGDGDTR